MLSAERPQFRAQMERVARVFDRQLTEPLLDDYWQALRHLSVPGLTARVDTHIRVGKFFPKPRDLLENPDGERKTVDTRSAEVAVDDWTATLNRVLRNVVMGVCGVPDEALPALVAEKNRIASQMREGGTTAEEWRDMVPAVITRLRDMARVARRAAGWPDDPGLAQRLRLPAPRKETEGAGA